MKHAVTCYPCSVGFPPVESVAAYIVSPRVLFGPCCPECAARAVVLEGVSTIVEIEAVYGDANVSPPGEETHHHGT